MTRRNPELLAHQPAVDAARRALKLRLQEWRALAEPQSEPLTVLQVHDLRVATTRLRTALLFFRLDFERRPLRKVLKRLCKLSHALGQRRDADVGLEVLAEFAVHLGAQQRLSVDALRDRLSDVRARAEADLHPLLAPKRIGKLVNRMENLPTVEREMTAGNETVLALQERLAQVEKRARRAVDGQPEVEHRLRIALKRFRYALELSESLVGKAGKVARKTAHELTNLLGAAHDGDELLLKVDRQRQAKLLEAAVAVRERSLEQQVTVERTVQHSPLADQRGLDLLAVYLQARRGEMEESFRLKWQEAERAGVWKKLRQRLERL